MLNDLWLRLRAILGLGAGERDLDDELRFHLDRQVEKHVSSGFPRDEASRRARVEFGGVGQVKEDYRDAGGNWLVETAVECAQEVRRACRMLARTPAFTAVAVLSLALGIGANSAMFSVADAELLRPLPVADAASVVTVGTAGPDDRGSGVSYPNYRDLREQSRSFEGLVAYQRSMLMTFARSRAEVREMHMGMLVSDNFFDVLGVQPTLGRRFTADEGSVPGGDAVVVLGHDFWKNVLAEDPSVLERSVLINGIEFNVVGIAPASFTGMDESIPAFFVPIMMAERLSDARENPLQDRGARALAVKGRLKPGASRRTAQAELTTLWANLERQYPDANRNLVIAVRTQFQERIQEEGPATAIVIAMMMALVAIVLIIACANVASLMLGRARARSREVAIRLALGVSRTRLVRQLLIESLVLSFVGCAVGLGFAYSGVRLIHALQTPNELRLVVAPQVDYRVLVVSVLAAVVSAVLCGLAPAWQSLKTQLVPALKSAEPGQTARHRTIGRNGLVVVQIALATVLLVVIAGMVDGFRKVLVTDPGFRTDHLLMTKLDTSTVRYSTAQTQGFYRSLKERARALPGVSSVALTSWMLLDRGGAIDDIVPEGYSMPRGRETVAVFSAVVDEHYFDTMKTAISRGRAFSAQDRDGSGLVAIVNQQFAKTYWPDQDPIGKRLRLNGSQGPWLEVVGLTNTGKYLFVAEPPTAFLYLPFAQHEQTAMTLLVETTSRDAAPFAQPLRDVIRDLDVNQPIVSVRTFSSLFDQRAIRVPLMVLQLVGAIALIGLTLALIGLYGLITYSVARRTREIGLRMAVGAAKSDVLTMVLRQGLMLAVAGILVGGVVSVGAARLVAAGMAGLGAPNPVIYLVVPVMLVCLTVAASYVPARRAAAVDPLVALKDD